MKCKISRSSDMNRLQPMHVVVVLCFSFVYIYKVYQHLVITQCSNLYQYVYTGPNKMLIP